MIAIEIRPETPRLVQIDFLRSIYSAPTPVVLRMSGPGFFNLGFPSVARADMQTATGIIQFERALVGTAARANCCRCRSAPISRSASYPAHRAASLE